jgi:hypothetical protein
VEGVQADQKGELAVVWGRAARDSAGGEGLIGVLDVKSGSLLRQKTLPRPVVSASIDVSGVYAGLNPFEPNEPRGPKPTQLLALDVDTLEIRKEIDVPEHVYGLQVLAGKQLVVMQGATSRCFDLPDLKPVDADSEVPAPFPAYGRLQDGWVRDGIVWDKDMKEPQLLLLPVPWLQSERMMSMDRRSPLEGRVYIRVSGVQTCLFGKGAAPYSGEFPVRGVAGGLTARDGILRFYKDQESSIVGDPAERRPDVEVPLHPPDWFARLSESGRPALNAGTVISQGLAEICVVSDGDLLIFSLPSLTAYYETFQFRQAQSTFAVESGKTLDLKYEAPGSAQYHLEVRHEWLTDFEDEPVLVQTSADGQFSFDPDPMKRLAGLVFQKSGIQFDPDQARDRTAAIRQLEARYSPTFRLLTGRKPKGIPMPVYVTVVAVHNDGNRHAALCHAVLVDIPLNQLR